jgi:hypothetical protein
LQRQIEHLVEELESHRKDAYAHNAMTSRMVIERDTRLTNAEKEIGKVKIAFEAFKAQAIVIGGIATIILGGVTYAVAEKIVLHGW